MSFASRLVLCLALAGCNGNYGTLPATPYSPAQAGAVQPFNVYVYNGTSWPLVISVLGGPTYLVPIGTTLDVNYQNLPGSIVVDAGYLMGGGTVFQLPGRTANLGTDYGPTSASVIFNYPFQ